MEKQEINEKIVHVMSVVFEVDENDINEDSSADTIDKWDSLRQLNLILALEEEFGVSIPDEEVGNMVNYKIIHHVINEML
ncbi:MAG: acyl carrier protein [Ginsengibacter sp.]